MIRLFSSALFVVLLFSIGSTAFAADDTTSSIGMNNCSVIDANWKEYKRSILGANTKISDVVLNACAVMGIECRFTSGCRYNPGDANESRSVCTPNTGVSNSQHRLNNAIDLRVPEGREAEFITLAICGLRKVNNCQGGIGYYKSKAIHVDVRTDRTSVWSTGYHRTDIEKNVDDPEARSTLYGFGDGRCVVGSIQGDDTERDIHGPTEEYTPPKDFEDFGPFIIRSQTEQEALLEALRAETYTAQYNPYYGFLTSLGGAFTPNFGGTQQGTYTNGGGSLIYTQGQGGTSQQGGGSGSGSFLDNLFGGSSSSSDNSDTKTSLTYNPDNEQGVEKATCEGSGLFGISLFSTCKSQPTNGMTNTANNTSTGGISTQGGSSAGSGVQQSSDTYTVYDATTGGATGVTSGSSVGVSYNFHQPYDISSGSMQQGSGFDNYGQFVAGQTQTAPQQESSALANSLRLTEGSILYGSYYGMVHGLSPTVIGSMPRTLWRIGKESAARVYNQFSI